jgi:hypothetical protein
MIMNRAGLCELPGEGNIIGGTNVDWAQTSLGLAMRVGAPKPDTSIVEAFLVTRLGIAAEMATKSTIVAGRLVRHTLLTEIKLDPRHFFGKVKAMISSLVTCDPVSPPPVLTTVTNCRPSVPR